MAARKAQNVAEYWPAELIAMTGNRLHYPQVKPIMRHICEFFSDQISCSVTNSVASSPCKSEKELDDTAQKTVKRAQIAMISNRRRVRNDRRDTSQDQTTSKKLPTSVVAINRGGVPRES
jgi:hypothetical protein